jgi:hypothetical protein
MLTNRDDPEKRIAELERQIAERKQRAGAPPSAPRRYLARPMPLGFKSIFQVSLLGFVLMAGVLVAMKVLPQFLMAEVMVFLIGGWGIGLCYVGYWIWHMRRRFLISVTGEGITVDRFAGELFSFSDARLSLWNAKPYGPFGAGMTTGRVLALHCGPHRFLVGGHGYRPGDPTPIDAPPVETVDAWLMEPDFDELLAAIGRAAAPNAPVPEPNTPAPNAPAPAPAIPAEWVTTIAPAESTGVGRWTWIGVSLFFVFCMYQGLHILAAGLGPYYEYGAGTPTTATVDHCVSHSSRSGGYEVCDATWTVNGVSQTGPLYLHYGENVGPRVDVHVYDGRVHPAEDAAPPYMSAFAGCFGILSGFAAVWYVWRKHKTGRWPFSGRKDKPIAQ